MEVVRVGGLDGLNHVVTKRSAVRALPLPSERPLRLAVVADTHSLPHPQLLPLLKERAPDAIVHAGDIGDLAVLDQLATVAEVLAVRGNIDENAPDVPDQLTLDVTVDGASALRILVVHIGVNGAKLRADVGRTARAEDAALVICGHSHVPLIAQDRGIGIFNPGSAGPRRFRLPIVFGQMDISTSGIRYQHVDLERRAAWRP